MSRVRKIIGLWIVLIVYIAAPFVYLFAVRWMDRVLGLPEFNPGNLNPFLAATCVFAGIFWSAWAYSYLHFVGKGSPVEMFGIALFPTQVLVTAGPYAYTRNPMLIGMLFLLLAAAFYANSLIGVVLVPVIAFSALVYIKMFEEPELTRRFGKKYKSYRQSVPVLIPSIRPRV